MARDADLLKQKLSDMEEEMHGERSRALEAEVKDSFKGLVEGKNFLVT